MEGLNSRKSLVGHRKRVEPDITLCFSARFFPRMPTRHSPRLLGATLRSTFRIVMSTHASWYAIACLAISSLAYGQDASTACDQSRLYEACGEAKQSLLGRRDCWNFGGWIAGGWTLNADGNRGGHGNAPYGYNNVSDGAVLNQLWLYAEKEIDEDSVGFDWGLRVDYLFGTDGPDNQAFGDQSWDFGWNSSRDYGSAIPQVYTDLKYDDLTVRVGYFLTPIGWEFVQAPLNFFYSHSFTFYYSEPNTHSGLVATYAVNDRLSLQGGWTLGIDGSFENFLNASTFLGGISYSFTDTTSINWSLVAGDWGDGTGRGGVAGNDGDIYLHSIIVQHRLADRLDYVFQHDLGINSNLPTPDTTWYAIVQYLTYDIGRDWKAGSRLEWFRDDSGVRDIGDAGDYYEITLGLNWTGCENVMLRPEVRWDWARGAGFPFDDGSEDEFFTYAISGVWTF